MLKGKLPDFSLGELFQSLAINHHTGTLSISAPTGHRTFIYFSKGEISLISHGEPEAPRLGEMLIREGKLTKQQLERALDEQKKGEEKLGKILLALRFITEKDIQEVLTRKLEEEIYEIFLWEEGEFEFKMDEFPPHLMESQERSLRVSVNTNAVIMEGLRRLDEWAVVRTRFKTLDEILIPTGALPESASELEREVFDLVDGKTPVRKIREKFTGVRFECCQSLVNLLDMGVVRLITIEEIRTGADAAKKTRDYRRAAAFLRFAAQLCSDEPQFLCELGECLEKSDRKREAERAYLQALRLYFDQGNLKGAGRVAGQIEPGGALEQQDVQVLFQVFNELKMVKKALWAGNRLATALQASGETHKAVEVLDSLSRLNPKDHNHKLQIARLLQNAGERERASVYYEEVARCLESQNKLQDQIKILHQIAELNPERQDVKQNIATLEALNDRLGKRRKRRFTLAGLIFIALLCCSLGPLVYEIKARELFSHAQRMEEIAMSTFDFRRARSTYDELLSNYKFSSRTEDARVALARIDDIERSRASLIQLRDERRKREEERKRQVLRDAYDRLLTAAKKAEAARNFKEAHRLYSEILQMGAQLPEAREILLPLHITSDPEGAEVKIDDQVAGVTPLVRRYTPGSEWSIRLSLRGCDPSEQQVTLETQYNLHFQLTRRPIKEFLLSSNFEQPVHMAAGRLIFTSREGMLYAFDPAANATAWEKRVGRFGDRVSDIHTRGAMVYLVTVIGEVLEIDARNGQTRWTARVRGPVLAAPSSSEDPHFLAVASLSGEVFVIDYTSGKVASSFSTENEIVARPVFKGDLLVLGSTDGYVYVCDVRKETLKFIRELGAAVTVDPVLHGAGVFFGTNDGRLHRLDLNTEEVAWSVKTGGDGISIHRLTAMDSAILITLSSGKTLFMNPESGHVFKGVPTGKGQPGDVMYAQGYLYVSFESGVLNVWNLRKNRLAWSWRADASLLTSPLIVDKSLYVPSASGAIQVLEVLE